VEVVGDGAQFTQPVYYMCENEGVIVEFNRSDFKAWEWVDKTVGDEGYIANPGRYELRTIDQNNCRLSSFIDVLQRPTPKVSLGNDMEICTPGFTLHTFDTENNPSETAYTWSTGESGVFLRSITVDSHDMSQNHTYWVRAELDGCVSSDTITVLACEIELPSGKIKIPNTFTPNDDGDNDVWNISGIRDYPNCIVEVFDRWGRRVFISTRGYTSPWDGRDARGRHLPMETYYYIIHLNDGKNIEPLNGIITIIR